MPTHGLWKKGSGTSSFKIVSKSLNFILTKSNMGMQRVVLLELGREDLPTSRLKVQIMLDCTFYFPKKKKIPSQIICTNSQHLFLDL